jgi:hypothetical protein
MPFLQAVVLGQDFAVTSSEDGTIKVMHTSSFINNTAHHRYLPGRYGTQISGSGVARNHPSNLRTLFSLLSHRCSVSRAYPNPLCDIFSSISFSEDGSRSPYTLSHLSVDGRFLLTWGPQRGLQLLDLEQRVIVFNVPATHTGVLDAVFCGAQGPVRSAASGVSSYNRTLMYLLHYSHF